MTITAQQKSIKDWSVSPSAISIAEEILLAKALLETITPLVNEVNKKVIFFSKSKPGERGHTKPGHLPTKIIYRIKATEC